MKRNESKIIAIIREEYVNRVLQLEVAAKIAEAELIDKSGNLLIAKDLKVKHKDSGYEYTVDRIDGDEENMVVYLREPEVPRFDPQSAAQRMNETDAETESVPDEPTLSLDKHDDLEQDLEQEGVFPVSAEEFKKEYIVD